MAGLRKEDLTGMVYGTWTVGRYLERSKYACICNKCGYEHVINGYYLKKDQIPKCKVCTNGSPTTKSAEDLTGKVYGQWTALERIDNKKWMCRCECGVERAVSGYDLRNGKSTGCGHSTNRAIDDLTGRTFGDWLVLKKGTTGLNGETRWLCRCICGTEREVTAYALKSGGSKSCGHNTTGFKDLTGQRFGEWEVLHRDTIVFEGDRKDTLWVCRCSCGTIRSLSGYILRNEISLSCGCKTNEIREQTCLEKYGVKFASQIGTTRTEEQLKMVYSKENMVNAIKENLGKHPKTYDVAVMLGLDRASTMRFIHKYKLENIIKVGNGPVSSYEKQLRELFPCEHTSDRKLLEGKELDLYYPEHKLAIEFNGDYWHSDLQRGEMYHQEKTIEAAKRGVQIFHIFEYEWLDEETRNKIINLLNNKIYGDELEILQARKCEVKEIESRESGKFLDTYHLQGRAQADIHLGIYSNKELIGVMTFGRPRFNAHFQWELIRLAWKSGIIVNGGVERLFKHFIKSHNPESIITYCDISKFTGNVYTRLGFVVDKITEPNYKWVHIETHEVLSRYQTQKQKLIELGYEELGTTEPEIMQNLGYLRVYDCGNLRLAWQKE